MGEHNNSEATHQFRTAVELLLKHRTDYAAAKSEFTWPRPSHFNWALDHFDSIAEGNHQPALQIVLESGGISVSTFEQLRLRSNQVANHLAQLGVHRGDRVLVMLPNRTELWEVMLGAMKIGAVLCPATMILSGSDLEDRIKRGRMRVIVADASCLGRFDESSDGLIKIAVGPRASAWNDFDDSRGLSSTFTPLARTEATDPCVLYFTSGTTSRPKMVVHSHTSYPIGHLSTMYWIGLQPGDVHLNISSPGWAKHAWSCLFAPWHVGATIFIYDQPRFDALRTLQVIADHKVTTLCAPPTAWRSIILEKLEEIPVQLRELVSAGEPLNPEVIERVKAAWGLEIREGYGQTESTAMLGNSPGQGVRYGSMGRPLPGYNIELINDDIRSGNEGEVSVDLHPKPVGIMSGYADNPERTSEALDGDFYGTGDVAVRDEDGYFWFVGRTDDVFKSSDYRISPFELESALLEHPAVAEAAVIESPDPRRHCVPKACVTLAPGHDPNEATAFSILKFSRGRLAPYQKIRIIEFCQLPKTISGKIRRAELRAQEAARRGSGDREQNEFFEQDFPELIKAREA